MTDKHEWRKHERAIYLPKVRPEVIDVPDFAFITLRGEGSPDAPIFADRIATLYSVAYGIKMMPKRMDEKPVSYFDFTVYPLEGVWDLNEAARATFDGTVNKEEFVYELMIRQPDFVSEGFFTSILEAVKKKKPNPLLDQVQFKTISEGTCIQMLHLGPYADEPRSFDRMEQYAQDEGYARLSKVHREIYLSDFRKVAPDRLRTVLRFQARKRPGGHPE